MTTQASTYRVISFEQTKVEPVTNETDDEIIERLRERFQILEDMTRAVKMGHVRAMVVSGPPGVGKSFGVEAVLAKHEMLADLAQDAKFKRFDIVRGCVTPIALYAKLYEFRQHKDILVFDDSDSIFYDTESLSLLKAALDSSKTRSISWLADSRKLKEEDIPSSFDFHGGIVFITNLNFHHIKSKALRDHLAAIESRCHYIDLTINSDREKMLRIRQIVNDGMLDSFNFTDDEVTEIVEFIDANKMRLRELSLRTVIKASDLKKTFGVRWQSIAQTTLMRA